MDQTTSRRSRSTRPTGSMPAAGLPAAAPAGLHGEVTARIIAELESGTLPWVRPWKAGNAPAPGMPHNAVTGRCYSGVNVLILWAALADAGYPDQSWLTFAQARAAGGCVRKGERGTTIVYADRFTPENERDRARQAGEEARSIAFLRRFTVFNAAQCDGIPAAVTPAPAGRCEPVPAAEAVITASGITVRTGGDEAWYSPAADLVQVPPQQAFFAPVDWYRTCVHELTHATGHPSRLDRDQRSGRGSPGYAREELVAEMGSAFLCAGLGIVPTVRHSDYIGCWLTVLRKDSRAIFRAAAAASRAADWLLSRTVATGTDETTCAGADQ